jgi:hypothetical protein
MRTELSTRERARQSAADGSAPRSRPRGAAWESQAGRESQAAQKSPAGRESPVGRAPRSGRGSQPGQEASAGVGTRTRTKPRPAPKPRPTPQGRPAPQPRTRPLRRGPQPPSPRPAPVRTGAALPGATAGAGTNTAPRAEASPAAVGGSRRLGVPRTPFVLLVLGLLGGGLICLLVINTTLATASFHINNLQQGNVTLSQQEQSLQQQIAQEQSPGSIAHRAYKLGMRYQTHVSFLNSKTGRISRQPGILPGVPIVPGFTP